MPGTACLAAVGSSPVAPAFGNRHSRWAVRRAWIHHLHLQRATSGDLNNQRVFPSISPPSVHLRPMAATFSDLRSLRSKVGTV